MGLLDRWVKRKTEEQLNKEPAKEVVVKKTEKAETVEAAPVVKKTTSKAKATTAAKTKKAVPKTVKEKAVKETVSENKKTVSKLFASNGSNYQVILKPVVTEKSAHMEASNKYVFIVSGSASKMQIKRAIKELYGVNVVAVHSMNVQGKNLNFGRTPGRRSDFKKAIVTLAKNSSLKLHEAV
jgi:large subunit ribosomal protein L23